MEGKLIKTGGDYLLRDMNGEVLAITNGTTKGRKLSTKNCDSLFGVFDVEKLAEEFVNDLQVASETVNRAVKLGYEEGFNKAMELNKDKVFTLEDIRKAIAYGESVRDMDEGKIPYKTFVEFIQSLQQPTEIEVEIVTEEFESYDEILNRVKKPILDTEGCLILKKK